MLLRGGRGAADRYRCVWGALTVFRPHWDCPIQGNLCFPRLHCSGSRLLHMEQALRCMLFQFSGPSHKCIFGCACVLCLSSPPQRFRQPGAWAHFPRMWLAFSLCGERRAAQAGLRESLDRNLGPVCHVGGGGFSGAEFAPFPSPLPPLKMYFILCVYLIYPETF